MDNQVTITISDVLAQTAIALQDTVKKYGPDAVDLGLTLYRIEGTRTILIGLIALASVIGTILLGLNTLKRYNTEKETPQLFIQAIVAITGAIISVIGAIPTTFIYLLDIYSWAAMLGHPEVLIAYKALVAAGLM